MTSSPPRPGSAGLSVGVVAGKSAVTDVWCASPIKLLTPRMRGQSVWAYMASFGGGMVAGDETSVDLRLGPGARCFFTTQASTKIYRNPQRRPCGHRMTAHLESGSLLVLAPDPVQSFAGSRYAQNQEFQLERGAGLVLLDWYSAGRAARGERWSFQCLSTRNDVAVEGKRCLLDSLLLDQKHGRLDGSFRLGRFNSVAVIAIIGDPLAEEANKAVMRVGAQPLSRRADLIFSAGPVKGGTILRVAGARHEDVAGFIFKTLAFVGDLLGDDPWAGKLN